MQSVAPSDEHAESHRLHLPGGSGDDRDIRAAGRHVRYAIAELVTIFNRKSHGDRYRLNAQTGEHSTAEHHTRVQDRSFRACSDKA
jgi:hypothetical protein